MKHYFSTFAVLALSVTGALAPNVKADEWDKKTNITINQPIEVQDVVLAPGSYVLKLVDLQAERYLVQVWNAEEDHVITTVFTTPAYKPAPAENSEFKFYESENEQPPALHTWFYPGDTTGFEFRPGHRGASVQSGVSGN